VTDDGAANAGALRIIRNASVFLAVVVAFALARFFQPILTPLVIATFLLLLADALSRSAQQTLPATPGWVRGGIAVAVILIAFAAVGILFSLEAPSFAVELRDLGPRLDALVAGGLAMAGAPPMHLRQLLGGVEPGRLLARVFLAARGLISYGVLVIIYFGFLQASRAAFGRKLDGLFQGEDQRLGVARVGARVRDAVERYVRLQTLKALLIAVVAGGLMAAFGVQDAFFIAFVVFLAAYVPIVGPIVGAMFPSLAAFAQYDEVMRPLMLLAIVGGAAFLIDNVLMPKLASDELNIDPLLVLISIGFWGAIFGAPGVLLSTPLTVTVMAITAEFASTRWIAVLLSRDGHPTITSEVAADQVGRGQAEAREGLARPP
jgi:predicted PurR-regulated permease PerM